MPGQIVWAHALLLSKLLQVVKGVDSVGHNQVSNFLLKALIKATKLAEILNIADLCLSRLHGFYFFNSIVLLLCLYAVPDPCSRPGPALTVHLLPLIIAIHLLVYA